MKQSLNQMIYGLKRSDIRVFSNLAKNTPGCLSLTLGEPDFDTPEEISDEIKVSLQNHETHYIANNGTLSLRSAIAEFENKQNGRSYTSDNVIVTAGACEGLFLTFLGILNPEDEVIILRPSYPVYAEDVKAARGTPVYLDTNEDDFQVNQAKLEALISEKTKAIVINTPNNPTGIVLNEKSLRNIYDAALKHHLFVICDDVYRQIHYGKKPGSLMDYEDLDDQRILIQSFSKPYAMTGWRMGYLCADASLIERLELLHQFMVTSTPSLFQRACEKALRFDSSGFIQIYRKRRDYILQRLEKMHLDTIKPEGAFYVFPSIQRFCISSNEFCRRMIQEAGLAATPGSAFGTDGYIRLSYCYSDEVLEEGMNRLEQFIQKLEGE